MSIPSPILNLTSLPLVRGTSFLVGSLGIFMGVRAILYPVSYAAQFGFHPSTECTKSAASNPFIVVSAGRVIASGVTFIACAYLKADRALSVLLISSVVTGAIDGYAVRKFAGHMDETKTGEQLVVEEEKTAHARGRAIGHVLTTGTFAALGVWTLLKGSS